MFRLVSPELSVNGPRKMALKSSILYVSCFDNTVRSFDLVHNNLTIHAVNTNLGNCGKGIAVNSDSHIYVADYMNNMIRYIKTNDQVIDIILTKNPIDVVIDSFNAIYYLYRYQFIVKYYNNRITYLGNSFVYDCLSEIIVDSENNIYVLDPCNIDGHYLWKIPYSDQNQREHISIHSCIIGSQISAITVDTDDNILVALNDGQFGYIYLINPNQSMNMTQLCLPNTRMNISGMVVDKSNSYLYISEMTTNNIYEVSEYCVTGHLNECSVYPVSSASSSVNSESHENLYSLFALVVLLPVTAFLLYYYYYRPREQKYSKAKTQTQLTDNRRI
jgi:streptogramin lyase